MSCSTAREAITGFSVLEVIVRVDVVESNKLNIEYIKEFIVNYAFSSSGSVQTILQMFFIIIFFYVRIS